MTLRMVAARLAGGSIKQRQRLAHALVVGLAFGGEVQAAAVALHQADAKALFQMAQVFAGHCGGNAEGVGGAGKTAAHDDLAEDVQTGQGIHGFLSGKVASTARV